MIVLSNSKSNTFTHCKRRYQLQYIDRWHNRETKDYFTVGKAVHKAIEVWSLATGEDRELQAYGAAEKLENMTEDIFEHVFILLQEYFKTYPTECFETIAPELDHTEVIESEILEAHFSYRGIIDSVVKDYDGYWVKEIKTSGAKVGSFWNEYNDNAQGIGYVWLANKAFDIPVKGFIVDVIFKPGYQRPDPICERRKIEISQKQIDTWLFNLIQIAKDIELTEKYQLYYKSKKCYGSFGSFACEFKNYCNLGEEMSVLRTSHKQKEKKD